jgi:membrane protease subunit HflC
VLSADASLTEYLTLDKKRVVVDYVQLAHHRPFGVLQERGHARRGARRIEDIVFSELRREFASQDCPGDVELREPTMEAVARSARARTQDFGIYLIDVRIKRGTTQRVQQSVFARMVAERGRIAKRYRSEGEEEAAKIRAETDKQREIILAQAYERSQRQQGEGDAAATAIYADAYEREPRFYTFLRTLEAYDSVLTPDTLLVLPADAALFRLLESPPSEQGLTSQR